MREKQRQIVCIDSGHPSEVGVGTRGRYVTEIHIAWVAALGLKKLLEQDETVRVLLTKKSERQFMTNRSRATIANRAKADIFIRLHCDSSRGSGFATYYPNRQGTAPDGTRGPSLEVQKASRAAAAAFHTVFAQSLQGYLQDGGLLPETRTFVGGKQGALTGSIYSLVPVFLVEMCVLTNPRDEAFVRSISGEEKLANALYGGILATLPN